MFEPDRRLFLTGATGTALTAMLPLAARAAGPLLQPAVMQRDIAVLCDALVTLHPGLHRYLTPAAWSQQRRRIDRFAARPRSLGDFYLALSALTASIRCGHSFPNPVNQPDAVTHALFDRADRLPFAFLWRDGRMIVTRDLGSGHMLAPGTEIVSIDGVRAATMLTRMLPYARTDGTNDARKVADLGIAGDAERPDFDTLRALLFPTIAPAVPVQIRANGTTRSILCRLMLASARDALLKEASSRSPYGWRFAVEDGIGVLTMPTWAVFHEKFDWQGFVDTSFDTAIDRVLAGIVIDLRDNAGGLDVGAAILARLIAAPLATDSYSRHVRYCTVPDRLLPFLDTWDRSFRDWGAAAIGPDANGFYTLDRAGDATDADIVRPARRRYTGKVAVLIGPTNASATFGFAALVKRHGLATLVGEPTGGNLRGINGGAFFFVRLPGSRIEIDLPLIAYWPDRPEPDAGVVPDIVVRSSIVDIAAGRDSPMTRAAMLVSG